jgi:hypothetical protein
MKGVPRQASPPGRRADAAAHVAQQFADALPALALSFTFQRLVFGGCTLGGEPAFFGVLRPARFCFPVEAIALGGNAGRKLWHELASNGALDQAPQVGDRAAHLLGLQPAGEFVEERLVLASHLAQQPLGGVSLLGQQPNREDQCFTTTHGRRERWLPVRR